MYAALALAMADPDAREPLVDALVDETSPLALVGLAQALGFVGEGRDAPLILAAVDRIGDRDLQVLAAVALGMHGTHEALDGLVAAAGDPTLAPTTRAAAIEGLGLLLDEHEGLVLAELSRNANFAVFPDWLNGALDFTL